MNTPTQLELFSDKPVLSIVELDQFLITYDGYTESYEVHVNNQPLARINKKEHGVAEIDFCFMYGMDSIRIEANPRSLKHVAFRVVKAAFNEQYGSRVKGIAMEGQQYIVGIVIKHCDGMFEALTLSRPKRAFRRFSKANWQTRRGLKFKYYATAEEALEWYKNDPRQMDWVQSIYNNS